MKENRNIPAINDKFDLYIFGRILKKSKWIILSIFALTFLMAFLYLRYTPRLYEASAVIQINNENSSKKLFDVDNLYEEEQLAQNVELIKSKQFLKPVLHTLPVKISYYNKGTFLAEELYKNAPIDVSYKVTNPSIIDKPIFFKHIDNKNFKLHTLKDFSDDGIEGKYGHKVELEGVILEIKLINQSYFENLNSRNGLFFKLNNPNSIYHKLINGLFVQIKNPYAKTIVIKYKGRNPLKTSEVVNAIASGYLKYEIDKKKESSSNILNFIDDQTNIIYKDLNQIENKIYSFKKKNNIKDLGSETYRPINVFLGKIKDFEDEVLKSDIEIAALEQISGELSKEDDINIFEMLALTSGTSYENVVQLLLSDLQSLLSEKDKLLNDRTSENRRIIVINTQIDNKKDILKSFIIKTNERLKTQKASYTKRISEYETKILKESDYDEVEYSRLKRYYSIKDQYYEKLLEKKAEYLISQAGYVSKNTILEKATVPKTPVNPNKQLVTIIAFVLGLILSIIILIVKYLFYNEISSVRELELYTNTPVIGSVPLIDMNNRYSQLVINRDTNSIVAESFRTIRSNLDFYDLKTKGNLIVISSTVSGEGKTFVAINFAGSLTMRKKKVIIIDLDLRKPKIHHSLRVENNEGMSRLLSGHLELEDVIKKSELEGLDFITADKTPPNPSELISGKRFENTIDKLKEIYDYIIIDTSPIGLVSDSVSLFNKADIPLYVLKANYSKRQFLYNLDFLKESKKIEHINLIFNGVDVSANLYGYQYGYGYGYQYGYSEQNRRKKNNWFSNLRKTFKKK